jgi:hypothetical protein
MHETIETTALTDHAEGVPTAAAPSAPSSGKACCACGKDVAGQKRFKDAQGRYWCYDCGVEDHVRKHPEEGVACAKCGEKFAPTKLLDFENAAYCEPCLTKQKASRKREQMRIAAAAEEARQQERRRKLALITTVVLVLAACALAVWRVMA